MRLEPTLKVSRLAKYAIFAYVVLSFIYASHHYFSIHSQHRSSLSSSSSASITINTTSDKKTWARKQEILHKLENIERQRERRPMMWSIKGIKIEYFLNWIRTNSQK